MNQEENLKIYNSHSRLNIFQILTPTKWKCLQIMYVAEQDDIRLWLKLNFNKQMWKISTELDKSGQKCCSHIENTPIYGRRNKL